MKWYRIHFKLGIISFFICLVFAIGSIVYYSFFDEVHSTSHFGLYYAYHVDSGGIKKAIILNESRNCKLLAEFQKEMYDSIDQPNVTPYITSSEDTVGVSMTAKIELVEILCDSTAGIVEFPNRFFHPEFGESKRNSKVRAGIIGLQDLHLFLADAHTAK